MTLGTLIYILLCVAGFFVSVFYLAYGAVAIVGILAAMPIVMFIFLILLRIRFKVSVDCKNPMTEKDAIDKPARAVITLMLENGNVILPVTKGIAKVHYENTFTGERGKMRIRFSVDAGKHRERRIPVVMNHCGNVSIKVEKVRIYDYLSIFAWTVGKKFHTQNVIVLPPVKEIYLGEDRWYNDTNEDSDRFSLYKKGDDPSEIFDIREYMDGDKIQRIHWKLSSKTNTLMVKEGSLPLTRAVNIFIDLCVPGSNKKKEREKRYDKMNLLIQGVYSISMFMIEHAIPQNYIWYDNKNEVVQERLVEHEEELIWMFQDLFRSSMTKNPEELVESFLAWEEGRPLESALYLTVSDHDALEQCGLVRDRLEVVDLRGDRIGNEEQ